MDKIDRVSPEDIEVRELLEQKINLDRLATTQMQEVFFQEIPLRIDLDLAAQLLAVMLNILNELVPKDFYASSDLQPQQTSHNHRFVTQQEQTDPKQPSAIFHNIRIQKPFSLPSKHMLRLFDKGVLMNQPIQNFEYLAE